MKCCCGENNFQVSLNKDHQCAICYSQSVVSGSVITEECLLGAQSVVFLIKIHHIEKRLLSLHWSAEIFIPLLEFSDWCRENKSFSNKSQYGVSNTFFLPWKKTNRWYKSMSRQNFTTTNSCPNWFFTDFCLAKWTSVCSSCEHLPWMQTICKPHLLFVGYFHHLLLKILLKILRHTNLHT